MMVTSIEGDDPVGDHGNPGVGGSDRGGGGGMVAIVTPVEKQPDVRPD